MPRLVLALFLTIGQIAVADSIGWEVCKSLAIRSEIAKLISVLFLPLVYGLGAVLFEPFEEEVDQFGTGERVEFAVSVDYIFQMFGKEFFALRHRGHRSRCRNRFCSLLRCISWTICRPSFFRIPDCRGTTHSKRIRKLKTATPN